MTHHNIVRGGAFTLIELLVVVAIIAVLTGILLPAVGKARESARKVACAANLRSVGQAIRTYMHDYNDFYPPMAVMPTTEPILHPLNPRPAMWDVLDEQVSGKNEVFRCPSDQIRISSMKSDAGDTTTYFEWQGSSYEPRAALSVVDAFGRWRLSRENAALTQVDSQIQTLIDSASQIMLVHEYEPFHSPTGKEDGRNVLFADFHVDTMSIPE